jgi:N utilization substance protein B
VAARSKARKRALDVLFEAELRGLPVLGLLAERMSLGEQPTPEYAAEIVRGVCAHRDEIDALMADNAVGWTLDRMPAVDRNVLRIGVWELLWADDVPDGVAISEAVALAQDLSTDGSPAFVNGLLAKVKQLKPGVAAAKDEAIEPVGEGEPVAAAEPADEGAADATGEVGGDGEPSGAEATSAAAGADQVTQAARRAAHARATRSGRGLVKPPRVATRPASSEEGDSSGE